MRKKLTLSFAVIMLLILLLPFTALADTVNSAMIRVLLSASPEKVTLEVYKGTYYVKSGIKQSDIAATLEEKDVLTATYSSGKIVVAVNGKTISGYGYNVQIVPKDVSKLNVLTYQEKGTKYRDAITIMTNGYVVNNIDLERYLYGVVGREIGPSTHIEAIKTQAVCARSYAYTSIGTGSSYDVKATTADQSYGGYTAETVTGMDRVIQAVDDTMGKVMIYTESGGKEHKVRGYYSTHAGGYTEDNENVWGGTALPYLRGVSSKYDDAGPKSYNSWTVTYTKAEFTKLVNEYMKSNGKGELGDLTSVNVYTDAYKEEGQSASGRVTCVEVKGSKGTVTVYRDEIRSFLNLKSTLFTMESDVVSNFEVSDSFYIMGETGEKSAGLWKKLTFLASDGAKYLFGDTSSPAIISASGVHRLDGQSVGEDIVIKGKGYGHGVGLSQWGAIGMAQEGYTYDEILEHYYGGTDPYGRLKIVKVDN